MTERNPERPARLSPLAATIVVAAVLALAASGYLRGPQTADGPGSSPTAERGPSITTPGRDATPDARRDGRSTDPSPTDAESSDADSGDARVDPRESSRQDAKPSPRPPAKPKPKPGSQPDSKPAPKEKGAPKRDDDDLRIPNVVLRDQSGRVIYRGDIDLAPTLERIEAGERNSHRNDGAVFQNREGRLPKKATGHYHEYVHPTPDVSGPGPQRVILGREGEVYYTSDHYKSFLRIR